MSIENFVANWTIRESTTGLIAVDDQLDISRIGNTDRVKFRCDSPNPDTKKSWDHVKKCEWHADGDSAGHLKGEISDDSDGEFSLTINLAKGSPNRIHIDIVGVSSGGAEVALRGAAGSAEGDDD